MNLISTESLQDAMDPEETNEAEDDDARRGLEREVPNSWGQRADASYEEHDGSEVGRATRPGERLMPF